MRVLILTQKVDKNDDILGFFHRWIIEFAGRCEKVIVVCLEKGKYDLPANVEVLSLGKELHDTHTVFQKVRYAANFFTYAWTRRNDYDAVFVHMNPIYVALGGWQWRLCGKRIVLWYTHKNVDFKLRVAEFFSDRIVTASAESFRLKSSKVLVVGHGIPVEEFARIAEVRHWMKDGVLHVVAVGRITPIKNFDVLVRAVAMLRERGVQVRVTIVGGESIMSDSSCAKKLHALVNELQIADHIVFAGAIPNSEIARYYGENDVSVNLCPDGGVDKVVLESMAAGCIPFASNRAFDEYFGSYANDLRVTYRDPADLAKKLDAIRSRNDLPEMRAVLLETVRRKSDVVSLVARLVELLRA